MKDFVAKISLYDILAMLIPGGTIFLFLSLTLGYKLKMDKELIDPILGWVIALVLSYLLGIINHVYTLNLWKCFRNNPEMIFCTKLDKKYCYGICQFLISVVVLLILLQLILCYFMKYHYVFILAPFFVYLLTYCYIFDWHLKRKKYLEDKDAEKHGIMLKIQQNL